MSDRSCSIVAKNISLSLGVNSVLEDVSFEIREYEFIAIVGPSGCGKTMLLNLIAGHQQPTAGTIECTGDVRRVYQQGGLLPWLTVRQNIALAVRTLPSLAEQEQEIHDILALIQMREFENYYPYQLSGGMKQRVELARAISGHGEILLMDEPFSAIDYLTRLKLRTDLLRILEQKPRTVVLVTHEVEEAVQLADRVMILNGRPSSLTYVHKLEMQKPRKLAHAYVAKMSNAILTNIGMEKFA